MKVVLDANVYLSALFSPTGLCAQILRKIAGDRKFSLVISESISVEMRNCLLRPKISKLTRKSERELLEWFDVILSMSSLVDDHGNRFGICRDPNDEMYLSAAVASEASYLVTGDKDLLVLEAIEGTLIVDPRQFWNLIS